MSAALTFLCVGVALWSAARSFSRVRRRWLAVAITGAAIVQVFLGLRGWLSEEAPRLHGTFVNPDHLAVYLEIALCVCFAMCTWAFRWAKREPSLELRVLVVATPIAAWFVIFSGLLLTGSRAGLLAALCGLAAQCFLLPSILKYRGGLIVAVLPATAGLVALGFMGLQKGLGRWLMTSRAEAGWTQRTEVWSSSLDLIGDFPLTGSGLGSFAQAFPLVQAAELVGGRWTHAHNDPLELLTTGGAVAGVLLLVGLVALVRALWRVVRDGNRTEDRVAGMAAIGALVSVGLHELVDFGLTLPANGLTLALLVGASAAARLSHQKGEA
jgi:O-antigen ligase